jgi:hypothetical protein
MKPRGYWKFSFWDLFETQRCGACGEHFDVPLKLQYLTLALSVLACLFVVFCEVYLTDPVSRLTRFLLRTVTLLLCIAFPHRIAYGVYLRAFHRAQIAVPNSTETT